MHQVPRWLTVIVLSRDVMLVLGYFLLFMLTQETMEVRPSIAGKLSTFLQLSAVTVVLVSLVRPSTVPVMLTNGLFMTAGAVTSVAGLEYMPRAGSPGCSVTTRPGAGPEAPRRRRIAVEPDRRWCYGGCMRRGIASVVLVGALCIASVAAAETARDILDRREAAERHDPPLGRSTPAHEARHHGAAAASGVRELELFERKEGAGEQQVDRLLRGAGRGEGHRVPRLHPQGCSRGAVALPAGAASGCDRSRPAIATRASSAPT